MSVNHTNVVTVPHSSDWKPISFTLFVTKITADLHFRICLKPQQQGHGGMNHSCQKEDSKYSHYMHALIKFSGSNTEIDPTEACEPSPAHIVPDLDYSFPIYHVFSTCHHQVSVALVE